MLSPAETKERTVVTLVTVTESRHHSLLAILIQKLLPTNNLYGVCVCACVWQCVLRIPCYPLFFKSLISAVKSHNARVRLPGEVRCVGA